MVIIKEISEVLDKELDGAKEYAEAALRHKDLEREAAALYYSMAMDEMRHVEELHDLGVTLINKYKAEGKGVPPAMQAVYDYLHERNIERASQVKMYLSQYK